MRIKILLMFLLLYCGISAQKMDTVAVVMLVCDTSVHLYDSWSIESDSMVAPGGLVVYMSVNWDRGYEVIEEHDGMYDSSGWHFLKSSVYWGHVMYLDEKKRPLHNGIIVWDSKRVE